MAVNTDQATLLVGDEVQLFEIGHSEPVDKGIITRIIPGELCFKSIELRPGDETEFRYFSEESGWRMLYEDPFEPRIRCFSHRGPEYLFHPAT